MEADVPEPREGEGDTAPRHGAGEAADAEGAPLHGRAGLRAARQEALVLLTATEQQEAIAKGL